MVVGMGQEYWERLYSFNGVIFEACFMQLWNELWSECTVKALEGQNSTFSQVKASV